MESLRRSSEPATILADYYEYDCRATIDEFLDIVKTGDKAVLSRVIIFPLERPYPIPSITRDEFLERYHEVFDEEFVRTIIESDQFDWDSVGWRGLMLNNGLLWLNYDNQNLRRDLPGR